MIDFENAMENAHRYSIGLCGRWVSRHLLEGMRHHIDAMAAAHADVVAERDSYREVARKLARYVLPDSDTLTIRQLVEAADAVCEAAEEAADDIQA